MTLFPRQQRVDDQTLKSYLLGELPQDAIERLDELGIVDDQFAARLDTAESDLVDTYVRGELSGDTLTEFESVYLASSLRRQKVKFAKSLYALSRSQPQEQFMPVKATRFSWAGLFGVPRLALAGGLAMLLVISVLLVDNFHLRNGMNQTAAARSASQKRESERQSQIAGQQASNPHGLGESQPLQEPDAPRNSGDLGRQVTSQI